VEIRAIRPEEYRAAGSVTADAFAEFASPDDEGWKDYLGLIADVGGRIERTVVLVAVEGGLVLGSVTIELEGTVGDELVELSPDVACMRMLGVDPSVRRRGIGRALARAVIDRAREAGKRELVLHTSPEQRAPPVPLAGVRARSGQRRAGRRTLRVSAEALAR
jgi:predicted N-acetyltransferase YhbS